MAGTRREVYEAGRADERAEIVAWLRAQPHDPLDSSCLVAQQLADQVERGEHAEAFVLGEEVPG